MEDNFKKLLEKRETALKKFVRKDKPYSNFINENFYTNQFILIIDPMFMRFSESDRVIEKNMNIQDLQSLKKLRKKYQNMIMITVVPRFFKKVYLKNL